MKTLETDYLVVGAGAAGLAFTDTLLAESAADVILVDRRHGPGGHWNDAYPFVRLHQPSAYYGVNSYGLGEDAIDESGPNAGMYERATGTEVCAYFDEVLRDQLIPSGNVRFLGMADYQGTGSGAHRVLSRLTGEVTEVKVRKKLVDATYLESSVPSTHPPSFGIDPGARFVSVNELTKVAEGGSGFAVIGGGKTGMDACAWLIDSGVGPEQIRWIRPRDSWVLDRQYQQPRELVTWLIDGISQWLEAAAEAGDVPELFERLEACGHLMRLDPETEPTMYRCATLSQDELVQLRSIENVVRLGHVQHIGEDRITLDDGSVPLRPGEICVDCSATGIPSPPPRPVFEPGRITLQAVRMCQPTFNMALIGYLEGTRDEDSTRNDLAPPNPYPVTAWDWIPTQLIAQRIEFVWMEEEDLAAWVQQSRLNAAAGMNNRQEDLRMQAALARLVTNVGQAVANLESFVAAGPHAAASDTAPSTAH